MIERRLPKLPNANRSGNPYRIEFCCMIVRYVEIEDIMKNKAM
jgi:hypothetical protein